MGRIKKYQTEEELRIANNKKAMKYYLKNKKKIRKKNLLRYYKVKENKNGNLQNNKFD